MNHSITNFASHKNLTLLAFLLLCLTGAAATVSRYTGSRIYWDARNPTTIFSQGGYARLIQLNDGRLMACCESGGIKVSFSGNLGRTWTTPKLIAPNADRVPNCVPDLIQLADGTIVVGYNPRPSAPYSADRRFGIRLRRSTDMGKTWSDEIFVYDGGESFDNGCWEPSFLQLPGGELQLYFADESPYTTSNEQQISLCRSFDNGLTWSAPQRISFRNGYRDGMPVPVLLADEKTIVVAIEDNGWSDIGDFLPTTVRCLLSRNWKNNYYIGGTSSSRLRCVNTTYCPTAKGGAPYLRVLPNGETVLSHQSTWGEGDNMKMYVYVGDNNARNFKAMSKPFQQGTDKGCWWNSVAVIDTGIVVAVGGLDGKVVMMKGYPMSSFQAVCHTPVVDGRLTSADRYRTTGAQQVLMGNEMGTFANADFAYDGDSLYATCLVYRKSPRSNEPYPDGINLYVEASGASTNVPMPTSYRFNILPNGCFTVSRGDGKVWTDIDMPTLHVARTQSLSTYRVEIAIPWEAIGLNDAPVDSELSVNLEIITGNGIKQQTERIPDADGLKPATWVPLKLIETGANGVKSVTAQPAVKSDRACNLLGQSISKGYRGIMVRNGRKEAVR